MNSKQALELLFKNVKENFNKRIRFKNYDLPKLEENCYEQIKQDLDKLEKLEKVIEILKGRICVHQDYVCYEMYADIPLKDNEIELLKEVLGE